MSIFKRISVGTKFFLEKLSSKPMLGGLEISDSALECVFMEFDKPRTATVRLPPGVFKNKKLQEPNQLLESLNKLHRLLVPAEPERILRVTLVLPSGLVYTQGFNVPNVGKERLKEAVTLNLQMISPIPAANANMSAQIIAETPDRFDLLGAFTDKNIVNQFKDILIQARFAPVAVEFPALSLTRLIQESVRLNQKSILVFQVSSEGLDIFILRDHHLNFNYFRSWQSIQGDERSIQRSVFDQVVIEEVRKVINFSLSRFNDSPQWALVIAPGFESEVIDLLERNFNIKVTPLVLNQVPPAFYAALGAAFRGRAELNETDLEMINLGGESLTKMIYDEQVLDFISLWRNITGGVFSLLLIVFIFAASFLVAQFKMLSAQLAAFSPVGDAKELQDLILKANEFNGLVRAIENVRGAVLPWHELLNHLGSIIVANKVRMVSLDFRSLYSPVSMFGTAPDYNTVFSFKNALAADPKFSNVNLPITQILIAEDNSASFNLSFQFSSNQ